jgi:hypothetical protein
VDSGVVITRIEETGKAASDLAGDAHCSKRSGFAEGCWRILSEMKRKELTPEQLSSIPCPTCGVAAGARCVLHSGAPRSEPHVERKFAATEAIEKK